MAKEEKKKEVEEKKQKKQLFVRKDRVREYETKGYSVAKQDFKKLGLSQSATTAAEVNGDLVLMEK